MAGAPAVVDLNGARGCGRPCLRPGAVGPLAILAVAGIDTLWSEAPFLGNHWLLAALVDAGARVGPERARAGREAREAIPTKDRALFEKLRAKRLELAKAQGVPPYVIFHDRTLAEMAARRPRSAAELAGIPGVGEGKLARYGEVFLEVIGGHRG